MANSFTWTYWTPTFPLIRERTIWLAAAAARSAIAFGTAVVDRYIDALSRASHVMKLFDALFGLAAIALSDNAAHESIANRILVESTNAAHRHIVGAEFAGAAFRSAINCLIRTQNADAREAVFLDRLSWRPGSLRGLATRDAFRLDPTDLDENGEMIGFSALPHVVRATSPLHYPLRPGALPPLLPALEEMPELLTRAWGPRNRTPSTIH